MSKLNNLIKELCPDGVEYRLISDLCDISRGRVMSKDYIRDNTGEYPVYSSQTEDDGVLGRINTYDYEGEYLTWTTDGANAGSVFYRTGKFSVTNVCGLLKVSEDNLIPKFLYYSLYVEAPKYVLSGMGNPKLMSNVMARIKVQIPPIEIQREIVRILDNFTELTAELTAELSLRKKQYEYYRDTLLVFGDDVPKKKLGEVCNISSGGDVPKGHWDKEKNNIYNIPIFSNSIEKDGLYGYTDVARIEKPSVTIAGRGAGCGNAVLRREPYFPIIRLLSLVPNEDVIADFLYYCVKTIKFQIPQSGIPQLTVPMVSEYLIPVPSLDRQKKIVSVLQRFDALCNDISEGLPAEIEARQKQYEYYRDKLLSFEMKEEIA